MPRAEVQTTGLGQWRAVPVYCPSVHLDAEGPAPLGRVSTPSKGARTRQAIIHAAIGRFVADGFQRTSMADIARDVGLSPSAVYRYFPAKEALFIAAVDEDTAGMVQLVRTTAFEGGIVSFGEVLARMRSELIAAVEEHPLASRALTGVEPMSPDRIMALPHLAELRHDLAHLLQVGQEHGLVRGDIAAKTLALGIETIVLYQLAHLASLRGADLHLDDERWAAIAIVVDAALRPGPNG